MHANYSRQACARWIVIAVAACFAAAGCQSVTMRGQDEPTLPFPEAGLPDDKEPSPDKSGKPATPAPDAPVAEELPEPDQFPAPTKPAEQSRTGAKAPPIGYEMAGEAMPLGEMGGGPPVRGAPSELCMTTLPTYRVEPPDILLINALKLVPKPPYHIEPLDILQIVVAGTLLGQEIQAQYAVDPSGMVDLGPSYGKVHVAGQTIDEATKTIDRFLRRILSEPEVSVVLAQTSGQQQVAGEHLIGLDGTINLGSYGSVYVAGMTLAEVKDAVEMQLSKYLQEPLVSVDVFSYQSKVYYVITQGAGLGDGVTRVPITGKETVLDALAEVNGLSRNASKKIWIARPVPGGHCCDQVLNVNYHEITAGAASGTNYQLLPGDRVFIAENKFIAAEAFISKVTLPFERIFGFALLGTNLIQQTNNFPLGQRGGAF